MAIEVLEINSSSPQLVYPARQRSINNFLSEIFLIHCSPSEMRVIYISHYLQSFISAPHQPPDPTLHIALRALCRADSVRGPDDFRVIWNVREAGFGRWWYCNTVRLVPESYFREKHRLERVRRDLAEQCHKVSLVIPLELCL